MDPQANPYATPTADLADTPGEVSRPPFYVVGTLKFLLLYIATVGMYSLYWFYKNWSNYKEETRQDIWPLPRAIFSIFFIHALFRAVDERLRASGKSFPWSPGTYATLLVVLTIASSALDRIAGNTDTIGALDVAALLIILPLAFVTLRAQGAINLACDDPAGTGNSRLTGLNILWLAIGAMFWIFITIGLMAA